ncbi:hypothetical protein Tco_1047371, partial [Tanacetum coccineum]
RTITYGKVKYCEDEDDCFTNFEIEFLAIVFGGTLTSDATLSFKPTVNPLKENEIDFRISFDESDDEDYTVFFYKNSFSYKIIYVDNLKTDSENDNDKVYMHSFPSAEPTVSYLDNLDYFKDFDKEFLAIVYNDALTFKLDSLTEPAEQSVMYFNDLFPLNIIYPDDLKSDTDNDDDEIDIIQSSGVNIVGWNCLNNWMPLNIIKNLIVPIGIPFNPKRYYKDGVYTRILRRPIDQRHPYLRFEGLKYTDVDIHTFVERLERIFRRQIHRGQVLDFAGLTEELREDMDTRLRMREFVLGMGLHTVDEIGTYGFRDFQTTVPSYVAIRDLVRRLCHRLIAHSIAGRGQAPEKVTKTDIYFLRSMDREAAAAAGALEKVEGAHDLDEVTTEYLVNISKRHAFWSLNEDIMKINDSDNQCAVSIKEDTAYPCLHSPKTIKETTSIRRIQRRSIRRIEDIVCEDSGRYQTWSYSKKLQYAVKMDDPNITIEEYIRLEEEKACRRAIVFNDTLTSEAALSCEPTANFEKEFLAIVYNDALTSKLYFLTEPTVSPQHIDEFNLKDETSLSECDEEEQNVICFNDLFPFKLIYPDDSKSNKDNNDDKIDMIQSSGNFFVKPLPDVSIRHIMGNGYGVSTSCTVLGPCEGKSTNVGEEFTNLEILKCWSLENSRRLFDINSCSIKSTWRIYRANIRGVSHSNSF